MNTPPADTRVAQPWRLCLAPMMQKTDRHFRYLVRLLSPHIRLYTEMITTGAILFGDRERFLRFDAREHPLAIQLGGSEPAALAECAALAAAWGYDEVNLNCGCPSDRVRAGAFGACLMREPARVARCVEAMRGALPQRVALSLKTRLGVDELYSYAYFSDFVGAQIEAGCRIFHIHARKAWLAGLSPRENREIPPLEYDWVYRLKREHPGIVVVINGGIDTVDAARQHLREVDGVMLGRHAYHDPYSLAALDRALFASATPMPSRDEIVTRFLEHVSAERARGTYLKHMSKHLLNLYLGQPGARCWRQYLTVRSVAPAAGIEVIESALGRRTAQTRRTMSVPGGG